MSYEDRTRMSSSTSTKQSDAYLEYYTKFKEIASDISKALSEITPDLDALSTSTSNLRKSLQNNLDDLPAHDKRIYETDLQQLEEKIRSLRKTSTSKSKFSFKHSNPKSKSLTPKTSSEVTPDQPSTPTTTDDHFVLSLTSLSSQVITIDTLALQQPQLSSLTISEASKTLIDLRTAPSLLACHAENISDSAILLPTITGSVILNALSNCVVVAQCQQFRIHSSRNSTILLHITSTPIIETSNQIRFGALLDLYSPSKAQSQHHHVRDFDYPDSESPNWAPLDLPIESHLNSLLTSPTISLDSLFDSI